MKIKDFFKKNISAIFWGMTIAFIAFAVVLSVFGNSNKNYSTNNCISAYAVEEEVLNIPFDLSTSRYRTCTASFAYSDNTITYYNRGLTFEDSAGYLTLENGKIYLTLYYNFTNSRYRCFTSENAITIDNYGTITNVGAINIPTITTLNDIFVYTNDYYKINLTDISINSFIIVAYSSGYFTPIMFFEKTNNALMNSMPSSIIYDTTQTAILDTNLNKYNIKSIADYGDFKLSSISYDWGINGNFNQYPLETSRTFYLTIEDKYQEGYNSGYDAGYEQGYEDAVEMTRYNPFDDTFVMGASVMAYQHGGEIQSNMGSSGYEYTQYGIKNTQSLKDWLNSQTLEAYAPYITYYRLGVSLTNASHSGVELNDESELYIGFYNSDDEFTYTLTENLDVYMVLKNANSNSSISLSFTLYSGSNAVIDFSNINGVDYSGYYFRDIDIRKSNIFSHDIYEFRFSEILGTYQQGYTNGYNAGISKSNYQNGYNQGYADASNNNGYTFFSLIGAVIDAPITYFTSLFDYEILGTNIKGFLLALLTIGIALAVIRISLAKK